MSLSLRGVKEMQKIVQDLVEADVGKIHRKLLLLLLLNHLKLLILFIPKFFITI